VEIQTTLDASLAENLLTLLCFDDEHCKLIRYGLTPQMFESAVLKQIAGVAIDFIDQFGVAVKEHLPDHLEDILNGEDQRKAKSYRMVLEKLYDSKDAVNAEFVMSQLHAFVRAATLKSGLMDAVAHMESGRIAECETAMTTALSRQVISFEVGTRLDNADSLSEALTNLEEPGFNLDIDAFDRVGAIPRRKQLSVFLAARGRGKSWWSIYMGKQALLQRWSVLIVTLELSEAYYTKRFLQSFFSISDRQAKVLVSEFKRGRDGSIVDVVQSELHRRTLRDDDSLEYIAARARREFKQRPPLIIKNFPTATLTAETLEAYLDGLQRHQNFTPDLILVDYPGLMKLDPKNKRIELGSAVERLRGIAVARNAHMGIMAQGNRESETAHTVTADMTAEDISLLATADLFFTYSQTKLEEKLNLARILCEKNRNGVDGFGALITQSYEIGQFCLDSSPLETSYWELDVHEQEDEDRPRRKKRRNEDEE